MSRNRRNFAVGKGGTFPRLPKKHKENMITFQDVFSACLPIAEAWFKDVVAGAVSSAIAAEREKEKPVRYFSREEVCGLLHISKPTLWLKTRDGAISAEKVGRRVLYAENEVQRIIQEGW